MRRGVIRRNTLYSKGVWGKKRHRRSFPGGSEGKESACNAGDHGSISGSRIKPVKGMATHSRIYQGNPMDRGAWWATVHEVTKSWTRLSD